MSWPSHLHAKRQGEKYARDWRGDKSPDQVVGEMTTEYLGTPDQITRLPHPAYSPDISPCDFWFFGWTKNEMQGKQFQGPDEVRIFLSDLWRDLDQNTLISVYHEWIARLEQVILMNGEYYSK
jgi:hypothetical protein